MYTKLMYGVALVTCLGAGACGPCQGYNQPTYSPTMVTAEHVSNGSAVAIGDMYPIRDGAGIVFAIMRTDIRAAPGTLTYDLQVYDGESTCPPASSSGLSDLGSATDTSPIPDTAFFNFEFGGTDQQLQDLDGKILVLRAADPSAEPTVGIVCTSKLTFSPRAVVGCHGSG